MAIADSGALGFPELASALSAACADAIETDALSTISNESLGQAFASIVRLYAAKAQAGDTPKPFGRNSGITSTDVAIGCTAMLDGIGLTLFDLGAWQTMTSIRPQATLDIDAATGA